MNLMTTKKEKAERAAAKKIFLKCARSTDRLEKTTKQLRAIAASTSGRKKTRKLP